MQWECPGVATIKTALQPVSVAEFPALSLELLAIQVISKESPFKRSPHGAAEHLRIATHPGTLPAGSPLCRCTKIQTDLSVVGDLADKLWLSARGSLQAVDQSCGSSRRQAPRRFAPHGCVSNSRELARLTRMRLDRWPLHRGGFSSRWQLGEGLTFFGPTISPAVAHCRT